MWLRARQAELQIFKKNLALACKKDDPLVENERRARKAEIPATSLIFSPLLNIKSMLIVS